MLEFALVEPNQFGQLDSTDQTLGTCDVKNQNGEALRRKSVKAQQKAVFC